MRNGLRCVVIASQNTSDYVGPMTHTSFKPQSSISPSQLNALQRLLGIQGPQDRPGVQAPGGQPMVRDLFAAGSGLDPEAQQALRSLSDPQLISSLLNLLGGDAPKTKSTGVDSEEPIAGTQATQQP